MSDFVESSLVPTLSYSAVIDLAGQIADQTAALNLLTDYRSRRAAQTLRRQNADLALFEHYLAEAGLPIRGLARNIAAWQGMTWGLVAGFREWQLAQGYAVGSVNVRLATIKAYAAIAYQAGLLATETYMHIQLVKGYGRKQAKKVDEKRLVTRQGPKKAVAVSLTKEQADLLKHQPDTPQGRRDAVLLCLLLDHGLRCGEIAGLLVTAFDLKAGMFTFHRPKVDKVQTHKMTNDTLRALVVYLVQDVPPVGALLLGSRKGGALAGIMSERAINKRVEALGKRIGVVGLSPHDCRHYWASRAARQGTDPFALQEAGGWNSLTMPRRYVEAAQIANEDVKL